MTTLSIRNLVKTSTTIQKEMGLAFVHQASKDQHSFQSFTVSLEKKIGEAVKSTERIFLETGMGPSELGIRSRRAYQWLKFLDDKNNLEDHLDALQRINLFLPGVQRSKKFRNHKVEFNFFNLGSLYKMSGNTSLITITAQEILIQAPDKVLINILVSVLADGNQKDRTLIHEYTFSPTYQKAREELEYLGINKGRLAVGSIYDLRKSFQRVNRDYFDGGLSEPNLVWSSRLTHRKFGHYQWDIDTVMVSKSLDQKKIPEYVVDFVMYHELLHKKLGAKLVNKRRAVHTSTFRNEESKFKKLDQAQKWLNKLSRKRK
jgi:hypothetical protein